MCFFSPIRNDPKKTHKQIFGTRPVPGQSCKFVYVYVFFLSLMFGKPRTFDGFVLPALLRSSSVIFSFLGEGKFGGKSGGTFADFFSDPQNKALTAAIVL